MTRLLYDGRYAPMSSSFGFIEAPLEVVVAEYTAWRGPIIAGAHRGAFAREEIATADLSVALLQLLPLTLPLDERCLFCSTRGETWAVYADNGHRGTDAFPIVSTLAERLQCRGVCMVAVGETDGRLRDKWPARTASIYGPQRGEVLNLVRAIGVAFDGKRWEYFENGTPQPWEESRPVTAKRKADRFTLEHLDAFLEGLGIDAFDESFYQPPFVKLEVVGGTKVKGHREVPWEPAPVSDGPSP